MKLRIWGLAIAALGIGVPLAAISDTAPQVIVATPGTGGSHGGAINRFTLRFSEAMVALGDPRAPAPAVMRCAVAGNGRWADAQTYVYEFETALPGGITCKLSLNRDLKSARGFAVTGLRDFAIDTGGPAVRAVLPGEYGDDIEEDQVFLIATNTPALATSINSAGYCTVEGIGEKIPLDVLTRDTAPIVLGALGTDSWEVRDFLENAGMTHPQASNRQSPPANLVAVKCRRPLPPGKDVALVWGSGIAAADGRVAGRDQRYDFTVRKAFTARFECRRVNPQAGCNPVEDASVNFTAPVPIAKARAIRLTLADGTSIEPWDDPEQKGRSTVDSVTFKGPLPAASAATLRLPANIVDESGRPLANGLRFPLAVRIDPAPPLVKFAANFGIIEANEGGMLPVTLRAVEPQLAQRVKSLSGATLRVDAADGEIAKWLRDVAAHEESRSEEIEQGGKTISINHTGDTALLGGAGSAISLAPPAGGKAFEVVGIPLKSPGFYVVELASPALGRALLGRNQPRYVASAALVTNMAVHFKWGRERSLAWVTTLDGAAPVAGADVRITDSCSGRQLARGTSDAQGRFVTSGLPEPETSTGCEEGETAALMISARSQGDFSFTLTDWGEGIRPYDFDLPFGYSAAEEIIHTIFDRSLIRQGETINMKHIVRQPVAGGFALGGARDLKLRLRHSGSGTEFTLPFHIGSDGIGENSWTAPKGAPMGDYSMSVINGDDTLYLEQSFRVDEFRLPTMKAGITGPRDALIRPNQVPLSLFAGYLSGGPAANLPVTLRTAFRASNSTPDGWDDWSFGGRKVEPGTIPLSGDNEEPAISLPYAQTLPATLAADGTARASVDINQAIETETAMTVEMDYQDANGETLTAVRQLTLLPSAVRLGIKTDGWMMRSDDLRLRFATIGADGEALKGQKINVELYSREILTARRRLIGGFYAYDNQLRTTRLTQSCSAITDKQGLAGCSLAPGLSGEITVVATTTDKDGNIARAVRTVWLAGDKEWWFGGDNGDRMDLIPEAKSYAAGATANFQVRMPFREATALVTVEREGVISSFVTTLSGTDPVVRVPMPAAYAPDVFVSVLAVRGRIGGWKLWTAKIAREWNLPFLNRDGYEPSALVDLAKPSYRIGIAKVKVGWEGYQLGVAVKADKPRYGVRDTAMVDVAVTAPGGKPPASAEIAFAAVDEALLQLKPNDSWALLDAMMGERPLSVLTSTAQTQVVGKRHYGRKAVEAGGGGGSETGEVTRDDFKPVLLWKGRVALDARGRARIPVQLSDSLSAFRLVAVASAGADQFGTGSTTVRTAQDLSIFSGLPPLVRSGDQFGASFTLRNATDKPMTVTARVHVTPEVATGAPLTVTIPAGGTTPVTWHLTAPDGVDSLNWSVDASAGKARDKLSVTQDVIPAVPVEVWAATLMHVTDTSSVPLQAPAGALPGMGFVDVRLSATLAPPLEGVRSYMQAYPYDCFEQQTSKLVVAGDGAGWDRLASEIPAYLDGDGLLRYWPIAELRGSEALTAYVLSVSAEAGFVIPEEPRAAMLKAMKSVLDGRLKRDYGWGGDTRLLRIAALGALARNGAAKPAMLGQIGLAPADMPTATLAEWLMIIDRLPGANATLRTTAEAVLRQRLVYEGTRLDLTDKGRAAWWMMSSDDEMALRALHAVLGRPGWSDEEAKMMVGAALRQSRGHWDTTTANAWGAIATRKFAKLYPAQAIRGTTTISLGSESRSQSWPMTADAGALRLALPMAQTPLLLRQTGGAGPWAFVSLSAAVPLRAPLFAGYRVGKTVTPLIQAVPGQWSRGDVVKVRISVEAGAGRNWVVIDDPVPPGATIIGNLGGQSGLLAAMAGGGNATPSYVDRGKGAWRGYFEWLPEGKFSVEYAMRLNGSGRFSLPPTRVEAMYSPEIRGQLPNAPVSVVMR